MELDQPGAAAAPPRTSTDESGSPQWLTEQERDAWLGVATIMFTLPSALDTRLQARAGLTFFEYMVLAVLSERSERTMQMSEIAEGVSASLSRLSHVVTKLEKRDLVVRARVPGSGRRTNVSLTDTGMSTVVAAAPDHVSSVRDYLIDALEPDDLGALRRIGTDVAARINPDRPVRHGVPRAD